MSNRRTMVSLQLQTVIAVWCIYSVVIVTGQAPELPADSGLGDLFGFADSSSSNQDACSLPCDQGTCEKLTDTEHHCLCYPGYSGVFCSEPDDSGVQTTALTDGGETDVSTPSPCVGECDPETTTVGDSQSEGPKEQCYFTQTNCYHGTCPSGFNCECDPGYTGATCNELSPVTNEGESACPEQCDPFVGALFCGGQPCVINSETCKEECLPSLDEPVVTSAPNAVCSETGQACHHGTCPDGHQCECEIGYQGDDCNTLVCTLPCVHGVCYETGDLTYGCHCDTGYGGLLCNEPECNLECVHGSCFYDAYGSENPPEGYNGSIVCTCQSEWIGELCDEPRPGPPGPDYTVAIAVGVAVPTVCVLAFILALYILWRHRVLWVFKFINMFKAYEDDDDKLYDAYISLSETDLCFVKSILQPRLEEMGLRIFLQARDSKAGEVKSESILEAVEKSRRCIMLISANYVNSEWCRFEYLIAQHETCVKLRQRIIPILLEDVEKDKKSMDKALRHIVDSVKCLRYPQLPPALAPASPASPLSPASPVSLGFDLEGNQTRKVKKQLAKHERSEARFWERLRLSMPKKKKETEVDAKSPSLSCDSTCPLPKHSHHTWGIFSLCRDKKKKNMSASNAYANGAFFASQSAKQGNPISLVSAKYLTDSKLSGLGKNDEKATSGNSLSGAEVSSDTSNSVTPLDVNTLSVRL